MKSIGVLNLQGAVSEHITMLTQFSNVKPLLVKHPTDLDNLDGLIIPGGESTAISRLINTNQLAEPIKQLAKSGKGIFGTCAGMVLCGTSITADLPTDQQLIPLGLIDIVVKRNGFGRQRASFETAIDITKVGQQISAVMIRAPYIASLSPTVIPLAYIDDHCIMAQSGTILVCSFHPELTDDLRVMRYFIRHCC